MVDFLTAASQGDSSVVLESQGAHALVLILRCTRAFYQRPAPKGHRFVINLVFCLPRDVPPAGSHPYLDQVNWATGCWQSSLGCLLEEREVWLDFLGFPWAHMILLLCFCGVGYSCPDLARHWMCLMLLLEMLAAVPWSQTAAPYKEQLILVLDTSPRNVQLFLNVWFICNSFYPGI